MRIGEFAKVNHISIDTIRHYMNKRLIHPRRQGVYYHFDAMQQKQLDMLLAYKTMGFTLDEIIRIMNIKSFDFVQSDVERNALVEMFECQKRRINEKISQLNQVVEQLDAEIHNEMTAKNSGSPSSNARGIAFADLPMIVCSRCKENITFCDGEIKDHTIYNGTSVCRCGNILVMRDGILCGGETDIQPMDSNPPVHPTDTLFHNTSPAFVQEMMDNVNAMIAGLGSKDFEGKTILVLKSGIGTMAHSLLSHYDHIKTLILLDDSFANLSMAKRNLDKAFPDQRILYINGSVTDLPVPDGSIDGVIDFLASYENHRRGIPVYQPLNRLLHDRCMIAGLYIDAGDIESDLPHFISQTAVDADLQQNMFIKQSITQRKRIQWADGLPADKKDCYSVVNVYRRP